MPVFMNCYKCPIRSPGCHDRCDWYQQEKRRQAQLKQQEKLNRLDGERVERERSNWIYRNMQR